ncbi:MAG: 3-methyladenine DNA glycosylase [Balneola sp.]|jgi:DNA-3-methyladenine glycosylase|nr:3-methyladenine DNA glycosylase [Balneola sp.]MBE80716.1 3-methyladenine DNA glycosylase [Balneola sp.]HBX65027.1 DNA-3-methyladenine glycosylase [Balneolaceae bacterium]|tara:strand:+ start:22159 stop:22758 length:600 start_codon:yes stop_codon:yes gene_type:complete
MSKKLPRSFYSRDDVVQISRELIGKVLCTNVDDVFTSGRIVETEAYDGRNDKACHAHLNKRTKRTEVMYGKPGHAYVYLCYGIHNLFNIVTNQEGLADAILIRAIEPVDGIDAMLKRRNKEKLDPSVGNGPGIISQALGINRDHYGIDLLGDTIWIEDQGTEVGGDEIQASERIGIDYAEEDAQLPWRFTLKGSKYVSK